jgi:hypothetical protein
LGSKGMPERDVFSLAVVLGVEEDLLLW